MTGCLQDDETGLVLRLATALWRFWYQHGYLREGRDWLETVLARVSSIEGTVLKAAQAEALHGAGRISFHQGDLQQAGTYFEQSLLLYRELDDRAGMAMALRGLGNVAEDLSDYPGALARYEEALELQRERGDGQEIARFLNDLCDLEIKYGNFERAALLAEESLSLQRSLDDRFGLAMTLQSLSAILLQQGALERAEETAEESYTLFQQLGHALGVPLARCRMADAAQERGQYAGARVLYAQSVEQFHELGVRWGVAHGLEGLSSVLAAQGEMESAARLLAGATALIRSTGAPLRPPDEARLSRQVSVLRRRLSDEMFVQAWEEGQTMPLDGLIEEAQSLAGGGPTSSVPYPMGAALSKREAEIVCLIAQGLTNRQIAAELKITERTATAHMHNVLKKLGFASRKDIALWATGRRPVPRDAAQQKRVGRPRTLPGRNAS